MNRKEFITKSAVSLATVSALNTLLAEHHGDHSGGMKKSEAKYAKALMSAIHCKLAAEICLSHCIAELSKGDKSLAKCAVTTREVIAACDAFIQFGSMESTYTKKIASLCSDICKACSAECKKHSDHHQVCKDCMDSCLACSKEMSKV